MYSAIYKKRKHKSMDQSVKVLPSRYVDMVENMNWESEIRFSDAA